ncbi:MAG: type III-A CRISPR-associated RAMP protein Csm3 [Prevotellaceae bacterium]|jgi:CRISPR-associated protein Csm3|nr:type III-A CRISPR-associated RAMP protein Csm3 [Prevotellaceae bacterium]
MRLVETKIVKGTITLKTGLHIGGSKSSLDIGGLDSPVIKTPQGIPYIPGSSLKGKIRSLLGLKEGSFDVKTDSDVLIKMFGSSEKGKETISRLIFRDAVLDEADFKKVFTDNDAILDTEYTEAKYENTIDRKSGTTKKGGLRQIERVPAGAKFNFEIVVSIFDDDKEDILGTLKEGIKLMEANYLGGSGSRGYGKVEVAYEIE